MGWIDIWELEAGFRFLVLYSVIQAISEQWYDSREEAVVIRECYC